MAINITRYSKHHKIMGVSCTGLASDFLNRSLSKMSIGTVFFSYISIKVKVKKKFLGFNQTTNYFPKQSKK